MCKSKEDIEFHHLIPNKKHTEGNLIPLCHECHEELHQVYQEQLTHMLRKQLQNHERNLKKNGELIENNLLNEKFSLFKKNTLKKFKEIECSLE